MKVSLKCSSAPGNGNKTRHVRFWHEADMPVAPSDVRFWDNRENIGSLSGFPLLTQSGQWGRKVLAFKRMTWPLWGTHATAPIHRLLGCAATWPAAAHRRHALAPRPRRTPTTWSRRAAARPPGPSLCRLPRRRREVGRWWSRPQRWVTTTPAVQRLGYPDRVGHRGQSGRRRGGPASRTVTWPSTTSTCSG